MRADPGLVATVSRWRHEAFLHDLGFTYEAAVGQLEDLIADPSPQEAALVAEVDGTPAGVCLLVRDEIDPRHRVTPWLASLYVDEALRGRGIGAALVGATETAARDRGVARLYLYASTAEPFYAALGWTIEDRFDWGGEPFVLMARDL
jgi:GNAT superfamily N-acetyltransferase